MTIQRLSSLILALLFILAGCSNIAVRSISSLENKMAQRYQAIDERQEFLKHQQLR